MTMRMLIDARHQEETRVAVIKGNRIEEFDFESAEHKQLKGNIYLAKVTRVEPSLQAAFVDYGGNRHGFLAFSEIHPDYYQIPKEDREALLREEAEHAAEEERLRSAEYDRDDDSGNGRGGVVEVDDEPMSAEPVEPVEAGEGEEDESEPAPPDEAESGSEESDAESLRRRRQNLRRRYKIQDVIRRRQVLLVQVVKEERGNKGAALTTYLSLAGRYCVLMPNTSHGGGISRKISNGADRKRLKQIMADLNLPSVMGLIVRTAGLQRTKPEIKRDFDYLARLWDGIRENTLKGAALTTYLSLAGRYCVLMPNTSHGGGISRKISSAADRKRLKAIMTELNLPPTMGCIVRTAGLQRTKAEIKRDFDYLARLWDGIREGTLKSSAPALIHSDSDLIKRAIRD
ncbi:MAG TPA: ribonuclease E/G, partial [Allosphingosinicella sp.]|nr:ribonuclease E/G [Allosphingosinicella sp.]